MFSAHGLPMSNSPACSFPCSSDSKKSVYSSSINLSHCNAQESTASMLAAWITSGLERCFFLPPKVRDFWNCRLRQSYESCLLKQHPPCVFDQTLIFSEWSEVMGTCQVWLSDGDGRVQPAREPAPRSLYILALCLNCIRGLCRPMTLSTVKIKLDALKSKPIFCRCQLSILLARLDLTQLPIYRHHESILWWAERRLGQLHFWPVCLCHLWCWQTAEVMPVLHASLLTHVQRRDWTRWMERLVVLLIRILFWV